MQTAFVSPVARLAGAYLSGGLREGPLGRKKPLPARVIDSLRRNFIFS